MHRRLPTFSVLVMLALLAVNAKAATGAATVDLLDGALWQLDPDRALTIERALADEEAWQPLGDEQTNFGYRKDAVWLKAPLPANPTAHPQRWRLDLRKGFLVEVDVWRAETGTDRVTKLLGQSSASRFDERPIPYRHLAFDVGVPPQGAATLIVRYRTTGLTELALELEAIDTFAERTQTFAAKSFLFQGVMIVLILAGVVTFVVARATTPLMYGVYLAVYALFVFHRDGYAFQFLWPNAPQFNTSASLLLGAALVIAGSVYTRMFLRTATLHPVFNRLLLANAAIAVVAAVIGTTIDFGGLKQWMVIQASASTLLFFAAGVSAARSRFSEVRFFVFGWLFAIAAAVVISSRHVLGLDLSSSMALDGMRIVAVLDAMLMGLALIDRYLQARARHLREVAASLATAQQNLELHERLGALQRRYDMAETLAEERGQVLADATHDLRQPIHALRMTIHGITQGDVLADDARRTVEGSFAHLEALVEGHLAATASATDRGAEDGRDVPSADGPPDDGRADIAAAKPAPVDQDSIEVSVILENALGMFSADAEASGIELRMVPSSARVKADPLALMRVLSNLLSNALKFTRSGRVLLGCRRRGDALSIEVHDTGPGMSEGELARVMQRAERGEADGNLPGHGLGLDIVRQVTTQQDWLFSSASVPGRGTRMGVCVPIANA